MLEEEIKINIIVTQQSLPNTYFNHLVITLMYEKEDYRAQGGELCSFVTPKDKEG